MVLRARPRFTPARQSRAGDPDRPTSPEGRATDAWQIIRAACSRSSARRYAFRVSEPVTRLCPVRYCPESPDEGRARTRTRPAPRRRASTTSTVRCRPIFGGDSRRFARDGADRENTDRGDRDDPSGRSAVRIPTRRSTSCTTMQPHVAVGQASDGTSIRELVVIAGLRATGSLGQRRWRDDKRWLVVQAQQRYLLEVGYVDRFVAEVLERLDATGLYDRALIVVTADHGSQLPFGGGDDRQPRATSRTSQRCLSSSSIRVSGTGRWIVAPRR